MTAKTPTWKYVKRATLREKYLMEEIIRSENEFEQQEPHGIDESDQDCPIVFRLENHQGYQMQAYTQDGKMMDTSFSECFVRCGNCGAIFSWNGSPTLICTECYTEYEE